MRGSLNQAAIVISPCIHDVGSMLLVQAVKMITATLYRGMQLVALDALKGRRCLFCPRDRMPLSQCSICDLIFKFPATVYSAFAILVYFRTFISVCRRVRPD